MKEITGSSMSLSKGLSRSKSRFLILTSSLFIVGFAQLSTGHENQNSEPNYYNPQPLFGLYEGTYTDFTRADGTSHTGICQIEIGNLRKLDGLSPLCEAFNIIATSEKDVGAHSQTNTVAYVRTCDTLADSTANRPHIGFLPENFGEQYDLRLNLSGGVLNKVTYSSGPDDFSAEFECGNLRPIPKNKKIVK